MKNLLIVTLVILLTACGGGSVPSNFALSGNQYSATPPQELTVHFLAYTTPLTEVQYVNIKNLAGTGIGATLSPTDLHTHYSFPSNLTGAGQTIAIVDAPGSVYGTAIGADLNTFSAYYKLPTLTTANNFFRQIDLSNGAKVTVNSISDWKYEVALDTQWVHAMAPAANIVLVTARSASLGDLMTAVQTASIQPGVVAISMSWGGIEFSGETGAAYDGVLKAIQSKGIVLLASSGDAGNNGLNQTWPATSPYVTSVGGTAITTVAYNLPSVTTESAWNNGGGGVSIYEKVPAFQTAATVGTEWKLNSTKRAIPDVSYNASPTNSPVGVVTGGIWYAEGGTSAGSPQWAAIVALIAQQRVVKGETSLQTLIATNANGFNGILYQSKLDAIGLFDVIKGSDDTSLLACSLCSAGIGYDAVTGLGVPNTTNLISLF